MWRRAYLVLALLRLYIALCPSYLHPDENFQGPEVIAGQVYGYPIHRTWEFTSDTPIRSAFPLCLVYEVPMTILKWIWEGSGHGQVRPAVVFWTLRVLMFALSFVLEDWAIQELVSNPRQRRNAILLVASSYVTWTWQVHTFSNSLETIAVLWSLVLMQRQREHQGPHVSLSTPAALAFLLVFGVFNRITFPAYVVAPFLQTLPDLVKRRSHVLVFLLSGVLTTLIAILNDTEFYASSSTSFMESIRHPTITPLNNLRYNSQSSNLAQHGTHPLYQHILANLPQLLGPAIPLLIYSAFRNADRLARAPLQVLSALGGVTILSFIPHQEARFLLPAIPLLLTTIKLPGSPRLKKLFITTWITFNLALGLLMGIYHQAGVYPTQSWLEETSSILVPNGTEIFWWKTYSPPLWLLNGRNNDVNTIDLMGLSSAKLEQRVCSGDAHTSRLLVAPRSATFLDQFIDNSGGKQRNGDETMSLEEFWSMKRHISLDDMDFSDDGVWPTVRRVVGRRGLVVWIVDCSEGVSDKE